MTDSTENSITVMIVDDEPFNTELLIQELEFANYLILTATSGAEAIEQALAQQPDIILLDIMMPGMDGYKICDQLKNLDQTKDIPIVFMTALNDTADKIRAFKAGGVDYITKPFQTEEVLARISTHVKQRLLLQQQLLEQNEKLREEIEAHQRSKDLLEQLQKEMKNTSH